MTINIDKYKDSLFLTGTRFWEISSKNSDYDYICNFETFEEIKSELEEKFISFETSKMFNGIKFLDYEEEKINLIPLVNQEIEIWKLASYLMKTTLRKNEDLRREIQNDKFRRIAYFESLKAAIRSVFIGIFNMEEDCES